MPRKSNTITVAAWPRLRKGRLYASRVKNIKLQRASNCLHVIVENLDPAQLGRIHEVDLPLPIRPGNRTCAFLVACGLAATTVGTTVSLDQITNAVVGFRLRGQAPDESQDLDFERMPSPPLDGQGSCAAISEEPRQRETT